MRKKLLILPALVLCVVLAGMGSLLSRFGGGAKTVLASAVWDGETVSYFAGGDGTQQDPYQISSGKELAFLAQEVNSGNATYNASTVYYKLAADIYLNDTSDWESWDTVAAPANSWTPIGTYTNKFAANFNGNGFAVYGVYINTTADSQGLFAYVSGYGKISNVGVEQSYINGGIYVGGVAGYVNGTITNCYNTGSITGNNNIGGVVGDITGNIMNCYNTGTVLGNDNVGGVVGYVASGGSATYCYYQRSWEQGTALVGIGGEGLTPGIIADILEFNSSGIFAGNPNNFVTIDDKDYSAFICALNAWILDQTNPAAYLYFDADAKFAQAEHDTAHDWVKTGETPAACTADAIRQYQCSVCLETKNETQDDTALGHSFTAETKNVSTLKSAATTTAAAVYWYSCSRCSAISDTLSFSFGGPLNITSGANGAWDKISGYQIAVSGNIADFNHLVFNGTTLTKDTQYTVTSGTITIKAEYLATLAAGDYNIDIVFKNGSLSTKLTIPVEDNGGIPGWAIALVVVGIIAVLGGGSAFYWFIIKRKRLK